MSTWARCLVACVVLTACNQMLGIRDVEVRADAVGLGNIATGAMIAGAVFAGAGLAVWLTAPSSDDVALGITPGDVVLTVRF